MAHGYYSLEEASQILGVSPDELKRMARRNEIRPFFDRGTMRFRSQEVDERARSLGRSSEAPTIPPSEAPAPTAPAAGAGTPGGEVFNFNLSPEDSQVEIGQEILTGSSSSIRKGAPKPSSPESPMPTKKSDSGKVKDSGMLPLVSDSDVKMVDDAPPSGRSGPKKAPLATEPKSGTKKSSKLDTGKPKSGTHRTGDSGVRLVPMQGDSDSDVKIVPDSPDEESGTVQLAGGSPEDSDIRIKPESGIGKKKGQPTMMAPPGAKETMQTEEIDLDAELKKAEKSGVRKSKLHPQSAAPKSPEASPFDLSDSDLTLPETPAAQAPRKEATPALPPAEDEEVQLGSGVGVSPHDSGINLQKVSDSGISLEKPAEDAEVVDFELKPDESGQPSTDPRLKKKGAPKASKSSESVEELGVAPEEGDSSEFELTLDDSGLAPIEEESATEEPSGEKDIFETDFEMPALEDESGFEPVPLEEGDTDLESSDFDLALGDEDIAAEEESGSQVVALEDEAEADEGAATVARPTKHGAGGTQVEGEEGIEDLLADEDIVAEEGVAVDEEEVAVVPSAYAPPAPPAQWGPLPVIFLVPCVLLLFFIGIMSFEALHTMWGYHEPVKPASPVVNTVTGWFLDIPKE